MKCEVCGVTELSGNQVKFCSRKCKSKHYYWRDKRVNRPILGRPSNEEKMDPTPLLPLIKKRAQETGGLSSLARHIADRYGTNPHSEERQLQRLLKGVKYVHGITYDKLETFLT